MDKAELLELIENSSENEHVEYKLASNNFPLEKLCKYCSALGNEKGGKIVFGIEDKTKKICGSHAFKNIEEIKLKVFNVFEKRINISEIDIDSKRILVIEMPSRGIGEVLEYNGIAYERIGESLVPMSNDTKRTILLEVKPDWSAGIIENASIEDLDEKAIQKARSQYKEKHPNLIEEIDDWDDLEFLNKAKIIIKNQITRTAILLLGKPESEVLISPQVAQISWFLKKEDGTNLDWDHFNCPFILTIDTLYAKIRNLKYRYMIGGTLFPNEIDMYDEYVIREALNNCIAHQDYELNSRINVIEHEDRLLFQNRGSFIPKSIENLIKENHPQVEYRNPFLTKAMVNLGMIDTAGNGIPKMFKKQKERYFPMPSFLIEKESVQVEIIGKIINKDFSLLLAQKDNLTREEVFYLDMVQKGIKISVEAKDILRAKEYVEGRYPNLSISKNIAKIINKEIQYTKNKGLSIKAYQAQIEKHLKDFGSASRKDIDDLLWQHLPEQLTNIQKKSKITNILYALNKKNVLKNIKSGSRSTWKLK